MTKLILLELNELNFDLVSAYIDWGLSLPAFEKLIKYCTKRTTTSEAQYDHLEPWVQWVSVHTGKSFKEHEVFRLGDIVNFEHEQFYESIERRGYKVGAVSPMNAKNMLADPAFFIPDPWTMTDPDGSWQSRFLHQALVQAVNDNSSQKITLNSAAKLAAAIVSLLPFSRLLNLTAKLKWATGRKWRKAIYLDMILSGAFEGLLKRYNPDFAVLFLNAGAHIQHHYMMSSSVVSPNSNFKNPDWYVEGSADPMAEVLRKYDQLLDRLFNLKDYEFIVATALSQTPCARPHFYYRLSDHEQFLKHLKIKFKIVEPRMTRDFLIKFEDDEQRDLAYDIMSKLSVNGEKIFGVLEMRSSEIFATLTYDREITINCHVDVPSGEAIRLKEYVVFVAIKNGVHDGKGYVFKSPKLPGHLFLENRDHVKNLRQYIESIFP